MLRIGELFETLVDVVIDRAIDRYAARDASLVSQRDKRGLGGRRHIDAVRRRIAEKRDDAWIHGRDYLMTPAAVRDELARETAGVTTANRPPAPAHRPRKASKAATAAAEREELVRLKRELEADLRGARR